MIDRQRVLRQRTDEFLMANKDRDFTFAEVARNIGGTDPWELKDALRSVVRCPFTKCQSYDTALSGRLGEEGDEFHRCNRCDRIFHVRRDPDGYSILGWYGE